LRQELDRALVLIFVRLAIPHRVLVDCKCSVPTLPKTIAKRPLPMGSACTNWCPLAVDTEDEIAGVRG